MFIDSIQTIDDMPEVDIIKQINTRIILTNLKEEIIIIKYVNIVDI